MYPLCCFCGELTTIYMVDWNVPFSLFSSNKQKIIAYTNEKLIFQAFHYHSQGNGKKWVIVYANAGTFVIFLIIVCGLLSTCFWTEKMCKKPNVFILAGKIYLLLDTRFFLKQRLKNHYCPWVNAYGFYLWLNEQPPQ